MGQSKHLPPNPTYSFCGLCLRSDRCIPDLIPAESADADVEITFREHPEDLRSQEQQTLRYASHEFGLSGEPAVRLWEIASPSLLYQLVYADGTTFVIDEAGSRVWATWAAESTFEDTLIYLLGPVVGFLLRLRGVTCLHASAIAIDGAAIALAGPGGAGKSTAAAQFASMGYPILSDDIVTLQEAGTSYLVQPAAARLRLWPPSVEHLYGRPDALPRLTASWEKQYLDLRTGDLRFQSSALPLTAIYVLSDPPGPAGEIEEIPRSVQMMQLLGNVYVNYLLDDIFRERDFVRITKVVNTVAVRKVNLQNNFAVLARTCRAILTDLFQTRDCDRQAKGDGKVSSLVSSLH